MLQDIEKKVKSILMEKPEARDDDRVLYVILMERINPIAPGMPFDRVFLNASRLGLPNYDSVSRARRKLQHQFPELRGSDGATMRRYKYWKEVRDYVQE